MEFEERAADPLAGGVQYGYQCGMVWGAALAAGAQAYRLFGTGPQAEAGAMMAAQRMVASFRAQNRHVNCLEITGIDLSSPTPGMVVGFLLKSAITGSCFGIAARYAPAAFDEINIAFSEKRVEAPLAPLSCSAILAQKMGASAMQTVMAAGFAGGIGLSGGACGALGAAIWILGMNLLKEGGEFTFQAPYAVEVIERFKKSSGGEFECSKIAGRMFESIDDHASYLRDGGCSKIIEALANHI
jgi:hypothetical protein